MKPKKEVTISVRLDEELLLQIEQRAENYNVSRASVIRRLLEDGMKSHVKLLPSVSSLEKQISSLNRKVDKIAEAMHGYEADHSKHAREPG
jgi:predicted transcriptional regulator